MSSIKVQKLVRNDDGTVKSGSAAIIKTTYDKNIKGKARKEVVEKLGKVIYFTDTKHPGIYLSPTRGLVEYDPINEKFNDVKADDKRIADIPDLFDEPQVHTIFGDTYLIIMFLQQCGLLKVLRDTFTKDTDYEKVLCHILYVVCKNGSRIPCDDFYKRSFASYVLKDIPSMSLGSDSSFFDMMGNDNFKVTFFKTFINMMRETEPDFGIGCYVDSTPLPNDIDNNPFNALCSHGVASTSVQTRLVLVLDENTGLPVWYTIIPGNVLDFSTIRTVMTDVAETLDIRIDSVFLDAGYVSKGLIEEFNLDSEEVLGSDGKKRKKTMVARMPAKNGYPFKELYHQTKFLIGNAEYEFIRKSHTYFGIRKQIVVFGKKEYAYVYIDKDNALVLGRQNRLKNEEIYDRLSTDEKNWYSVKFGYFVIISNKLTSPAQMLDEYFSRTQIETIFKCSKEYLKLLPLCKWTIERILGKLLTDIIATILYSFIEKKIAGNGISRNKLLGSSSSLMCLKTKNNCLQIDAPNKNVRTFYECMGIDIPSILDLKEFENKVLCIS